MTIVSDWFNNSYWNYGNSFLPAMAVDSKGNVHVVWYDYIDGKWVTDLEIMHVEIKNQYWQSPRGAIPFGDYYIIY